MSALPWFANASFATAQVNLSSSTPRPTMYVRVCF